MWGALLILGVLTGYCGFLWLREKEHNRLLRRELIQTRRESLGTTQFIQRRAEMLHRLVDGVDDGFFILDKTFTILFANRSALSLFPPLETPVGKSFLECVRDHRLLQIVQESFESQERLFEEILVKPSVGTVGTGDRIYSVFAIPLSKYEPAGLDQATLVVLRDETAKHELEKIRKDFVANASHELRTPLSIIIGYLENLKSGDLYQESDRQRAYQIMKKHSDRLARMVEDLLVISRMESAESNKISPEWFNFSECANEVITQLEPLIDGDHCQITVQVAPTASGMIWADRFYLDQILFNLVSNAIKENSHREVQIILALDETPKAFVVQVIDNGVGIPGADLPFIFKRFYRINRQEHSKIKGTGLGLSIVRRAIEAHQGEIHVESVPGQRTAFMMHLQKPGAP